MKDITLLGIDLAKNVFQLHGVDSKGKCVLKKRLSRTKFIEFMAQLPKCTVVMECCGSAHYWGRKFISYGQEVKLISPQYVKPYVKGNKNDGNDAEGIVEAASRPSMRFVKVKTIEQQDIQMLHRIRERFVKEKTALSNQIRGILAEYGIVMRQGHATLKKLVPVILKEENDELSAFMRTEVERLYDTYKELEKNIEYYNLQIDQIYTNNEDCQRIGALNGVGPMTATAMIALGDVGHMRNGRHFSAFLGLVPRQYSSGNKQKLLGISKRGNPYIRKLLIHGARSAVIRINNKTDAKSQWLRALIKRRGINRTAVALANKNARIIWKILTTGDEYKPELASGFIG